MGNVIIFATSPGSSAFSFLLPFAPSPSPFFLWPLISDYGLYNPRKKGYLTNARYSSMTIRIWEMNGYMENSIMVDQNELRTLLKEVLQEYFDPDYGLEIAPDLIETLKKSTKEKEEGKGVSLEEARKILKYR